MASHADVMGKFIISGGLRVVGWLATGVMGAAVIGMFVLLVIQ
jgi:hypothetical protein